jgi:GntR family transcriptional regulator
MDAFPGDASLARTFSEISRSRMARYLQLATLFRNRIATGEWPVGGRIPNVADLAEEFSVARGTIREAMDVLDAEGLVERIRAKGSFVKLSPAARHVHRLESNWESLIETHAGAEIRVLEQEVVDTLPAALTADEQPVSGYQMMRRLHLRDGVPYLVGRLYLDRALYRLGPPKRFKHEPTLPILHEIAGDRVATARQVLTIGTADIEMSRLLEIPLNSPVAHVHRRACDAEGRLLYVADGVYRGDMVRLDIELR